MEHKLSEVLEMEVSDLLEPKKVTNADLRSDIIMKDISAFFKDKKVSKKKKRILRGIRFRFSERLQIIIWSQL